MLLYNVNTILTLTIEFVFDPKLNPKSVLQEGGN